MWEACRMRESFTVLKVKVSKIYILVLMYLALVGLLGTPIKIPKKLLIILSLKSFKILN